MRLGPGEAFEGVETGKQPFEAGGSGSKFGQFDIKGGG